MQGSFRFFKILKKSCPMRTDLPVPNSPARIIIVFLGIPLGRTLSRASIPVSSNPGKFRLVPSELGFESIEDKSCFTFPSAHVIFPERLLYVDSTSAARLFVNEKSASSNYRGYY